MNTSPVIHSTPRSAALAAVLAAAVLTTIPARGAPWTPQQLSGRVLWLDASDATTVTLNGSTVSQWNDKTANGKNVAQGTAASQPAYVSSGLNGLSVVRFDGSNDSLLGGVVFASGTSCSVLCVLKYNSATGTGSIYSNEGVSGGIPSIYLQAGAGTVKIYGGAYASDGAYTANQVEINAVSRGPATATGNMWRDGTQVLTNATIGTNTTNNGFLLGRLTNALYGNFDLAELIALDGEVSVADRQKTEGYLAWKWGQQAKLPAGHPYKDAAPDDADPPTIATLSPANNATGVAVGANLVATFSQSITVGTGNITIKNLTDNTQSTIAITDGSQVSVAGSVLTINPTADLAGGKSYAIRIDATAIQNFAGIADDTTWTFTTDGTPPTVVTLSPADDATDGLPFGNLVVTFNEAIAIGTGDITIKNLTDNTQSTIAITDGSQVSVAGSVLTINPTADLAGGKDYAIRIDAMAIKDGSGNFFAGIADDTTWNFATDGTPPTVVTLSPADDTTGVAVDINLTAIFDENIQKGTGNITLKKSADNSVVETFVVATSPRVTVSGTQVTIDPTSILTGLTGYYVEIDAGAIKDLAGNSFAGISGSTAWNFTTIALQQLTWDANGGGAGQTDGGGTWLAAGQWWDGSANTTWSNYNSAAIGSGGSGGTITLGTVSANSVLFTNFTDTYTLSGGSLAVASGLTVNSDSGNVTISTPIGGAGGVAKSGTATLTLSGNNTYAGGTTIDAGMVVATKPQAAGTGTVTVNGDGTLRYTGVHTDGLLGNTLLGGGTFEWNGTGGASAFATVSGNLNGFSGTIRVDTTGGYASLATPSAGSALAKWVLRGNPAANQQGYYLLVGQGGSTYEIGELSSASDSGGGVLGGGYTVSTTWQIGGLNTSSTFRGTIQNGYNGNGPVSVTKVGSGTLTLTGTNYYTGATTISAGTLLVNSPGTLAAASAVTVNGGTLGGNGTINGAVTVAAAGSVAPGASAGTLKTGALNVSAMANGGSGKLNFELDADTASSDQIAVTGTLTIGSDVLGLDDFTFTNLGGLASGTYTLITTTAGISGTLDAGNLTGTILTGFTGTLQITGNNLELVVSSGATSPYDTWAAQIPDTNQRGRGDDPDGDGFSNGEEFLFGSSPVAGNGSLVTTTSSGGNLTLRWLQRESGATYTLQQSATLEALSWTTAAQSPALDGDQTGAPTDYDYYSVTIPVGSGKLFYRIMGVEN